ncbi:putative metal-dependent phosphoesterase [Desulfamplus magnetovallimortis]|uniref:Putative metal-dependent phosphoesterase n=1 Tax=Desulfamplus magnetovallimortis TaxID=1246637 RepID=A0A1W1HIM5_9BACT|nr:PHP domain-containing protein [Desulfamplus magnetovallimortis]SLM32283.1 putative metal-dependent phosphoesterase [Desulfamplus magnetovallimortis]
MKSYIYADLHNHTTASDGDFAPSEIVNRAEQLGIAVLGITDHDNVAGVEDALLQGDLKGVEVIPGVEISVRFKEPLFTGTLHLLCYFDRALLDDLSFRGDLDQTLGKGRGDALVKARVSEINRVFGPDGAEPLLEKPMTFEEVASYSPAVTRRHFALALNEIHKITEPATVNEIIGNESPAYLPSGIDLASVSDFTGRYPVLTVLAHPAAGSFPGKGHYREVLPSLEVVEELFPRFLEAGIRGIEINYPGHIDEHRRILRQWAAENHLVETGGSDCHDEKMRPMGVEGINKDMYEKFKALLRRGRQQ